MTKEQELERIIELQKMLIEAQKENLKIYARRAIEITSTTIPITINLN